MIIAFPLIVQNVFSASGEENVTESNLREEFMDMYSI